MKIRFSCPKCRTGHSLSLDAAAKPRAFRCAVCGAGFRVGPGGVTELPGASGHAAGRQRARLVGAVLATAMLGVGGAVVLLRGPDPSAPSAPRAGSTAPSRAPGSERDAPAPRRRVRSVDQRAAQAPASEGAASLIVVHDLSTETDLDDRTLLVRGAVRNDGELVQPGLMLDIRLVDQGKTIRSQTVLCCNELGPEAGEDAAGGTPAPQRAVPVGQLVTNPLEPGADGQFSVLFRGLDPATAPDLKPTVLVGGVR